MSTSQSIAVLLGEGEKAGDFVLVVVADGGVEGGELASPYCSSAVSTLSRLSMRICRQSSGSPAATRVVSKMPEPAEAEVFLGHGEGQHGRGDVRQVAGQGQRLVVFLGRHLHDHRAERLPELLEQIEILGAGVLRGREDRPRRPSNRSAEALLAPAFSLPAKGWLPRKRQPRARPPSRASTIACFALPTSVISVRSGQCWAAWRTCSTIWPDRRADDDQFGVGHALVQVDGGMGDGADAAGHPQAGLPAADADDVFCQISLAQGQADRPADQSHPHNGDGVPTVSWRFDALLGVRRYIVADRRRIGVGGGEGRSVAAGRADTRRSTGAMCCRRTGW